MLGRQGARAAAGWDGDRYAVFEGPDQKLGLVWFSTWDNEDEAREFARAYARYQTKRQGKKGFQPEEIPDSLWRCQDNVCQVVERRGADVTVVEGFAPGVTASPARVRDPRQEVGVSSEAPQGSEPERASEPPTGHLPSVIPSFSGTRAMIRFVGVALLALLVVLATGSLTTEIHGQDPFQAASESRTKDQPAKDQAPKDSATGVKEPERIVKTNEEWAKQLTHEQFMVTRMKATEPAFSGKYSSGHFKGVFLCVCCGAKLFDARTKFESGTGWPSFWRPISEKAVDNSWDYSEAAEARVEVTCHRCGSHLGHVFQDGPPPTGLRYCMNSLALKLDTEKATSAPARRKRAGPTPRSRQPRAGPRAGTPSARRTQHPPATRRRSRDSGAGGEQGASSPRLRGFGAATRKHSEPAG